MFLVSSCSCVSAQSIGVRCQVKDEGVVGAVPTGDAPTTSEWSTILLTVKVHLTLEVWWYIDWININTCLCRDKSIASRNLEWFQCAVHCKNRHKICNLSFFLCALITLDFQVKTMLGQDYDYKSINLIKPAIYVKGYTNYYICIKCESSGINHGLRNAK